MRVIENYDNVWLRSKHKRKRLAVKTKINLFEQVDYTNFGKSLLYE